MFRQREDPHPVPTFVDRIIGRLMVFGGIVLLAASGAVGPEARSVANEFLGWLGDNIRDEGSDPPDRRATGHGAERRNPFLAVA